MASKRSEQYAQYLSPNKPSEGGRHKKFPELAPNISNTDGKFYSTQPLMGK